MEVPLRRLSHYIGDVSDAAADSAASTYNHVQDWVGAANDE
jgi:hypothetical protein